MAWKDENDKMNECMVYEVEAIRPRDKSKKTWTEILAKDGRTR